jgi:eukaryotic-like serine/threonine-protein kinase
MADMSDPALFAWAELSGPRKVLGAARRRLESGRDLSGAPLSVDLTDVERADVARLLGITWQRSGRAVSARELNAVIRARDTSVEELLAALGTPVRPLRAERAEQQTRRAAQGDDARLLAAKLTPYPAAGPLVAILSGPGGPYRDHAIEAALKLLESGALPGAADERPWHCVRWLARGRKADYRMEPKPIQRGGQGVVSRATHKLTEGAVVVKQLRTTSDNSLRRMGREIEMGQSYGDHPNVMPVLDADPSRKWLVMPYAEGGSAEAHAERLRTETGAMTDLIASVCEGLRRPHAADNFHRDIKPANILLLNGRWVVADWGLVRRSPGQTSDPALTHTGEGFGSAGFAAPEQASGNPHRVRATADIYSIGRLIAAILTGETPQQNRPLSPEPGPWLAIVRKATQDDPDNRPQDIDEFLQLLKDHL